jgi:hypothetical protein
MNWKSKENIKSEKKNMNDSEKVRDVSIVEKEDMWILPVLNKYLLNEKMSNHTYSYNWLQIIN